MYDQIEPVIASYRVKYCCPDTFQVRTLDLRDDTSSRWLGNTQLYLRAPCYHALNLSPRAFPSLTQ